MIFGLDRVKTVPLSRSLHGDRVRARPCFFSRHLVGTAVELLQSFALHLQFHLRILFEDLRVALADSAPPRPAKAGQLDRNLVRG